jgi:hypothetical protein
MRVGGSIMGAKTVALATLLVGAFWTVIGQAAPPSVPMLLTEQGRLTDSTGAPITTATKLTFNIYLLATKGIAKWTEKQTVTPAEGYFSVELGSVTALPLSLFTGVDLYLGVTVGSDPEMTPRQHITSVPYAFVSDNAIGDITPNSVTTTGNISTTGAISGATGTFSGALAANGGITVGGTTIIDSSGNLVGPLPASRPFVGNAVQFGDYYLKFPATYGGVLTTEPGSFVPSFNGTCLITITAQPYISYTTPTATDVMFAYPYVNSSTLGDYCYAAGYTGNGEVGSCTVTSILSVTASTTYDVGCYAYGSAGYANDELACNVSWVCTP